ncbi:multidrug resistance efflux pump [Lysinibacillus sphaericus]|uniref:Multidrug resistance efflux pump n=1 Tax=Lysinibacillus sphaericus OT4b.31 TaxID=1285586 RepID=R7ZH09_LYSSH|nr:multidrug resistance efflux pump [Lysinibacillus sphaericus]EON73319.1 multidrug resistance efflux pump [Lysinibacillus sphaericus OT4b.31]
MFGSIFYNLWGALIAFSIYFFMTFQKPLTPLRIIIGSFVAALIVFFVMYLVRLLITYILYTPGATQELTDDEFEKTELDEDDDENQQAQNTNSTVEFQDENSEDIAQVVRTMMSREDEKQVNA